VNRSISFAARNIGSIPPPGGLTDADCALLEVSRQAFDVVGESLSRSRFKASITEVMRTLAEANKYLSEQAPWKLRESDPDRMNTILHVALQLVDDGKTLMTPFLPKSSQLVHEMLGGKDRWADMPEIQEVDEEGGNRYPVIAGDYSGRATWESTPIKPGTPLEVPKPLFAKIDPGVVIDELNRLGGYDSEAEDG
jgi:methionyl-tRNA synthetase